ncbi:MAG: hypothetical protein DSM106950_28795 [Stigonema ocellatum SAG 48.90 = DSM 106950]|nr:hypothetical protein [Stigonema ocellatum SAG 48.90 = DSM 106950]
MVKFFLASVLTTATVLTASTAAMADSLVCNGSGGGGRGDYSYELWQSTNNNGYYLKIWKRESYKKGTPLWVDNGFKSSGEARDYFDCNYTRNSVHNCSISRR